MERRGPFLALALVFALAAPAVASAKVTQYTIRSQAFSLGGFETILPKVWTRTPEKDGYITRFYARLVYANGRRVPIQRVMLHHIVFVDVGYPGGAPKTTSCPGRRAGESFWGTGEEHEHLVLPPGYGYHVDHRDHWRLQAMLMSHSLQSQKLYIQYSFTMVTGTKLTPVKPLWLRANGCQDPYPSYEIQGGEGTDATDVRSTDWAMPISGRIVAAGAHLHGSAKDMTITQPACGDRTLIDHKPLFGFPTDKVYRVRPILHEPGPIATAYFMSKSGIPVARGTVLRVTGYYDGQYPHPQVMAISHVYVARDNTVKPGCQPIPSDAHYYWTRKDGRPSAPRQAIPFNAYDASTGKVAPIDRPPGPEVVAPGDTTVSVADDGFHPANLTIVPGASVTWSWTGSAEHNVFYADGPRDVDSGTLPKGSTYHYTFNVPGTYRLFCWLHPLTMHQVVTVTDSSAQFGASPPAQTSRVVTRIPGDVDDGYGEGDGLGL
jgi:plastocyanin